MSFKFYCAFVVLASSTLPLVVLVLLQLLEERRDDRWFKRVNAAS